MPPKTKSKRKTPALHPKVTSKSTSHLYLTTYNAVSSLLWSLILYTTLDDIQNYLDPLIPEDYDSNYYVNHEYKHFPHKALVLLQLFNAIVEITHSITGFVKSPLPTTLLQFTARLFITLGICYKLPESPANYYFPGFIFLSLAWSLTEIIRYGFYTAKSISPDAIPYSLIWLRYSLFFILYPVGLVSEFSIVYKSLDLAKEQYPYYYYFLIFGLVSYLPGFIVLFSYMFKQRGKVLSRQFKFRKFA